MLIAAIKVQIAKKQSSETPIENVVPKVPFRYGCDGHILYGSGNAGACSQVISTVKVILGNFTNSPKYEFLVGCFDGRETEEQCRKNNKALHEELNQLDGKIIFIGAGIGNVQLEALANSDHKYTLLDTGLGDSTDETGFCQFCLISKKDINKIDIDSTPRIITKEHYESLSAKQKKDQNWLREPFFYVSAWLIDVLHLIIRFSLDQLYNTVMTDAVNQGKYELVEKGMRDIGCSNFKFFEKEKGSNEINAEKKTGKKIQFCEMNGMQLRTFIAKFCVATIYCNNSKGQPPLKKAKKTPAFEAPFVKKNKLLCMQLLFQCWASLINTLECHSETDYGFLNFKEFTERV